MIAPVIIFGGKGRIYNDIIALFPKHDTFCDVFGGTGVILLNKPKSALEVYNDIDCRLYNLYNVLKDEEKLKKLQSQLELTLWSRTEFENSLQEEGDDVEKARRFIVNSRQSFAGKGDTFGVFTKGGSHLHAWCKLPDVIQCVHDRFKTVLIECRDYLFILKKYDTQKTLFYLDPPYHPDVSTQSYRHKFSNEQHRALLEKIQNVKGMVVLSGYECEAYSVLIKRGWGLFKIKTETPINPHLPQVEKQRIECVWLSPNALDNLDNQTEFLFK